MNDTIVTRTFKGTVSEMINLQNAIDLSDNNMPKEEGVPTIYSEATIAFQLDGIRIAIQGLKYIDDEPQIASIWDADVDKFGIYYSADGLSMHLVDIDHLNEAIAFATSVLPHFLKAIK